MKKITISIFIFAFIVMISPIKTTFADEIVMCMSSNDQYVVVVENKDDCLEEESQITLEAKGLEAKKSMTPIMRNKPLDDCEGEGLLTEVGFDDNGDGTLDSNEVLSSLGSCTVQGEPSTEPEEEES